jgi:hypothetical protein
MHFSFEVMKTLKFKNLRKQIVNNEIYFRSWKLVLENLEYKLNEKLHKGSLNYHAFLENPLKFHKLLISPINFQFDAIYLYLSIFSVNPNKKRQKYQNTLDFF